MGDMSRQRVQWPLVRMGLSLPQIRTRQRSLSSTCRFNSASNESADVALRGLSQLRTVIEGEKGEEKFGAGEFE